MSDELTKELLAKAAEELNQLCGFKPPIDVDVSDEQLRKDVVEAASESLDSNDCLTQETFDTLAKLGVSVKARVALAGQGVGAKLPLSQRKGQKNSAKEEVKEVKEVKKEVKKDAAKKAAEKKALPADVDKYGFRLGTKTSEGIKMLEAGKHTMADVAKKFGTQFQALKKIQGLGFKVKTDDSGKYSITK